MNIYRLEIQELIFLLSASLNLLIAFAVLFANRKNRVNQIFSFLLISIVAWIVTLFLFYSIKSPDLIVFYGRLNFAVSAIMVMAMALFSDYFPRGNVSLPKHITYAIIIETLFLAGVTLFTPLISENEIIVGDQIETVFGRLYWWFLLHLVGLLILSFVLLTRKYRQSRDLEKTQFKYLFLGFGISISFGLLTNIVFPLIFGVYSFQPIGPLGTIFLAVVLAYSIVQKRLFGIRFILGKVFQAIFLILFPYGFFYLSIYLEGNLFGGVYNNESYIFGFLLSIVFVALYNYVDKFSKAPTFQKYFFKGYDLENVKIDFVKELATILDIDQVISKLFGTLQDILHINYSAVMVVDKESSEIQFTNSNFNAEIDYKTLYSYVKEFQSIETEQVVDFIVKDELINVHKLYWTGVRVRIYEIMEQLGVSVLIPLSRYSNLRGLLILSDKDQNDAFSREELTFLDQLVRSAGLAMSRALLYSEVSDLNKNLQQKVDDATEELQEYVAQLEDARRRERDMMDIMGHELRTPLSIIKIKQSLLRNKAERHPEQFTRDEFLQVDEAIRDALEREIRLLETMLSSTKIDAGRMELNLDEVELKRLIDNSVLGHTSMAQDHKLELSVEPFDEELSIFADPVRIAEVLDNFVNNALKYTPKGSVKISVEADEKFVTIHVQDTGIGISPDAINHLGEKWYRENQYIEHVKEDADKGANGNNIVRPGGSGLGLYVAFGLIKQMGGSVNVESELGVGSTFSFTVPRFVGQKAKIAGDKGKDLFKRMKLETEVVEGELSDTSTTNTQNIPSDNGNLNKSSS